MSHTVLRLKKLKLWEGKIMDATKLKESIGHLFFLFGYKLRVLKSFLYVVRGEFEYYLSEEYSVERKTSSIESLKKSELNDEQIEVLNLDSELEEYFEKEYLPQYLYRSLIACLWSETERLLEYLVNSFEKEFGSSPESNKYLSKQNRTGKFIIILERLNGYGLKIKPNQDLWNLKHCRDDFIHNLWDPQDDLLGFFKDQEDKKSFSGNAIRINDCLRWIETVRKFVKQVEIEFERLYKIQSFTKA